MNSNVQVQGLYFYFPIDKACSAQVTGKGPGRAFVYGALEDHVLLTGRQLADAFAGGWRTGCLGSVLLYDFAIIDRLINQRLTFSRLALDRVGLGRKAVNAHGNKLVSDSYNLAARARLSKWAGYFVDTLLAVNPACGSEQARSHS